MQVFDWDRFSKNDPMGEVKLQLGYFDLTRAVTEWRQLQAYSGKVSSQLSTFSFEHFEPFENFVLTAVSRASEHQHREILLFPTQTEVDIILRRGEAPDSKTSSR